MIPADLQESAAREKARRELHPNAPKQYQDIEDSLEYGKLHPGAPWGFVIVRTVYGAGTDEGFARVLSELTDNHKSVLEYEGQGHIFPRHELTVIEDEASLDGADSHTVRDVFRAWIAEDLTPRLKNHERWGGEAQVREKLRTCSWNDRTDENHPIFCMPARWMLPRFAPSRIPSTIYPLASKL